MLKISIHFSKQISSFSFTDPKLFNDSVYHIIELQHCFCSSNSNW